MKHVLALVIGAVAAAVVAAVAVGATQKQTSGSEAAAQGTTEQQGANTTAASNAITQQEAQSGYQLQSAETYAANYSGAAAGSNAAVQEAQAKSAEAQAAASALITEGAANTAQPAIPSGYIVAPRLQVVSVTDGKYNSTQGQTYNTTIEGTGFTPGGTVIIQDAYGYQNPAAVDTVTANGYGQFTVTRNNNYNETSALDVASGKESNTVTPYQ